MASGIINGIGTKDISSLVTMSTGSLSYAKRNGNVISMSFTGGTLSSGYGVIARLANDIKPSHDVFGTGSYIVSGHSRPCSLSYSVNAGGVYVDSGVSSNATGVGGVLTYII
jgi:hypothetical protein